MKKSVEFVFVSDKHGAISELSIRIPIEQLEEAIANARKQEPIVKNEPIEMPVVIHDGTDRNND